MVGKPVLLLPQPEHAVHEAVVEEEDRIETGRVVFAHITIGPLDRRAIIARRVIASHGQVHAVVRGLQRHHRHFAAVEARIPLSGGGRIGKGRVIGCIQASDVLTVYICLDRVPVHDDVRGQPVHDVLD